MSFNMAYFPYVQIYIFKKLGLCEFQPSDKMQVVQVILFFLAG